MDNLSAPRELIMRNILETIAAAAILALGALWAFIVLYAYVHLLFTGASYLWRWLFH